MTRVQFFGHHEESNVCFLYVIVASEEEEEDYENAGHFLRASRPVCCRRHSVEIAKIYSRHFSAKIM